MIQFVCELLEEKANTDNTLINLDVFTCRVSQYAKNVTHPSPVQWEESKSCFSVVSSDY